MLRQLLVSAGLLAPLGLDTFAVAASLGMAGLAGRDRLRVTLIFTAFEAGMPIVGFVAGSVIGRLLGRWAEYVGIALVLVAGVLLLWPRKDEDDESRRLALLTRARGIAVLSLGVGVSVDELTIGLSAGLLGLSPLFVVIWIGLQAAAVTQLGLRLGARIGERMREGAERVAGLALITVALGLLGLVLVEH